MDEKIEITEKDMEEMCQLAEDVIQQLRYQYCEERDNADLLEKLFRRGDDIGDVRDYTKDDILPWIEPIIPKVLKLFRDRTSLCGDTNFVAGKSVPDEYLIAVFAREVRNMMMIFAGQRLQREMIPRYLLLLETESCHDGDEWIGIYFDDENLRQAYEQASFELEEKKKRIIIIGRFMLPYGNFVRLQIMISERIQRRKKSVILLSEKGKRFGRSIRKNCITGNSTK